MQEILQAKTLVFILKIEAETMYGRFRLLQLRHLVCESLQQNGKLLRGMATLGLVLFGKTLPAVTCATEL
jgi:hypothetical protein